MTKLCPRGKAAAKRKFKVYPSAYANAYASKICAGKIKDPSGVKRKDFRGSKAEGGLMEATQRLRRQGLRKGGGADRMKSMGEKEFETYNKVKNEMDKKRFLERRKEEMRQDKKRIEEKKYGVAVKGGGMISKPRAMYRKGGGVDTGKKGERRSKLLTMLSRYTTKTRSPKRAEKMGGGMMRPMYRKGGGVCLRGMNRDAIGKNS